MNRIIAALIATLLSVSFGAAFADEKAMKEHQEMGTQGVAPHMTKEKEKELAQKQREQAMKEHQEMGTAGVTPHMTKEKQRALAKQQREEQMKKHTEEGTKGVTPHELKKKPKQAVQAGQGTGKPAEPNKD